MKGRPTPGRSAVATFDRAPLTIPRNVALRRCENQNRANLELRAPIARFMAPMRLPFVVRNGPNAERRRREACGAQG